MCRPLPESPSRGLLRRGHAGLAMVVLFMLTTTPARGESYKIEVRENQLTTVSGSAGSLKALIVDLCRQARVELLTYGADDRPLSGNYHDLPLSQALARLLRSEDYMVGLRGQNDDGTPRIAWLRVMGPNDSAMPAAPPVASTRFVLDVFISGKDPAKRKQVIRKARTLLESNSDEKTAFLRADTSVLARQLAAYPDAQELMVELRTGRYDYLINRRLGMLSDALDYELREQTR